MISESLKSKIFLGEHAPRPPYMGVLSALFSKGDLCNPPFLEAGYGPEGVPQNTTNERGRLTEGATEGCWSVEHT